MRAKRQAFCFGPAPILVFVLLLPLVTLRVESQITGGVIQGIVSDPQGGAVPGGEVTAANVATGQSYTTETNATGIYEFPALNPGVYNVEAKAVGFATYLRKDIELALQQRLRVDISMQVGSVQQSIEVSGTPTLVNTDSRLARSVKGWS